MIFDNRNTFEYLRKPGIKDSTPIRDGFETIEVYNDRKEIVKTLVADAGNARWTFGYDIYFATGRHACMIPSLEPGYCTSRSDAILFMLGYMRRHPTKFSDAVIAEIDKLIAQSITPTLF